MQRGNNGYTFETSNTTINFAAYADDLANLGNEIKSLQIQMNKVDKFCEWSGMDIGVPQMCNYRSPKQIQNGLTRYILAKYRGSQNIPRIKKQDCP